MTLMLSPSTASDLAGFAAGQGHPDYPCLSRTHAPASCVPCVDFSPWLAERVQRPVLVMQPNKTLAAQFTNELRQFFPRNAVEYFVSYYDYYQPEAYVPQTDTYIEKDSSLNEEVEPVPAIERSATVDER